MDHSKLYKNAIKDGEELRRRRCDQSVEIRKARKNESLQKRRNMNISGLSDDDLDLNPLKPQDQNVSVGQFNSQSSGCVNAKQEVEKIKLAVDDTTLYPVITCVRKLLSRQSNPPIDAFVQAGVVEAVVPILTQQHSDDVIFEALWVITNVASGISQHTMKVVEEGSVGPLLQILDKADITLAEQAVWALGNIAGESAKYRDMLCDAGIVLPLIKMYKKARNSATVVGNIAWVMSNLCRNKDPPPKFQVVESLMPTLAEILLNNFPPEIKVDAMWALAYATETNPDVVGSVIRHNLAQPLVNAIGSHNHSVLAPALRCLGNMVTGSDEQTECVCECGLLSHILPILTHTKPVLVKEAVWLLSNIAAGTEQQIQYIINVNLIPTVLSIMKEGDVKSKREAVWVISNMCQTANQAQLQYLLALETYNYFINMMNDAQPKNILLVLDTLSILFKGAVRNGSFESVAISFESHDGLEMLEALQEHENELVYNSSFGIINEFFGEDELESSAGRSAGDQQQVAPTFDF